MGNAYEGAEIYEVMFLTKIQEVEEEKAEDKFHNIQKLKSLRKTMSINYPNSFKIKEVGSLFKKILK